MKKKIITIACICVVLGWLYSKWDWYWPGKYEEMPVVPFLYNDGLDNAYFITSSGKIYYFKYSSLPDNWLDSLEQNTLPEADFEWLHMVGIADIKELQKQYNRFCKVIVKNRKYHLYPTKIEGNQTVHDYGTKKQYWTGFYRGKVETIFKAGVEGDYRCSDERAYWIVDWINEQIENCGQ